MRPPRSATTHLVALLALAGVLAGCGTEAASPTGGAALTPGPSESATASPTPSPSPTARPIPTPIPTPTPAPTAPTVEGFWNAVLAGIRDAGRVRLTVIGSSPGVLRYEPDASATVVDGAVVFICADGAAFDGQGGAFIVVPGTWECGGAALVGGFRNTGQPVDAWGEGLLTDASIAERTSLEPDGRWRWEYEARSAVFGGTVTTTVWVDPLSGRLLDARRSDPTGETRYGISYSETFPPITRP